MISAMLPSAADALGVLAQAAAFGALACAAAFDVARRRIPDSCALALAASWAAAALAAGAPLAVAAAGLAAGAACLAAGFGLFAAGALGAGDAKLLAAAGLWAGWSGLAGFLLAAALAGGAVALLYASARRARTVPYGVAIAAGGLYAVPRSAIVPALP